MERPGQLERRASDGRRDDVVINLASPATIRLTGGAVSVHSLQINNLLVIDGSRFPSRATLLTPAKSILVSIPAARTQRLPWPAS